MATVQDRLQALERQGKAIDLRPLPVSVGPRKGSHAWEPAIVTKSAAYTARRNEVVLCDVSGAGFTVTLPLAGLSRNAVIVVKKVDASANTLTIGRSGSDTIDGATTQTTATQWGTFRLVADPAGSRWLVI